MSIELIKCFPVDDGDAGGARESLPWIDRVVLLVDDHEIVRCGIRGIVSRLFEQEGSLEILEASTLAEASALVEERRADIDLLVLDLSLPDAGGAAVFQRMENEWRDIPVVVVSATEDWGLAVRFLKAGVLGFIPKSSNVEVMTNALRLVFSGGRYFPDQVFFTLAEDVSTPPDAAQSGVQPAEGRAVELSPRQREVLSLILRGRSNKEIARDLDISLGTVKNHVAAILHAFNVNSRAKAALAAIRHGFQGTLV